jgi:hypothetical protein
MKVLGAGGWVLSALLIGAAPLAAQVTDSAPAVPPRTQDSVPSTQNPAPSTIADSARRPTTPIGAMFRSFLIPGWGQATYGRKVSAGIMMGVEGLSIGMLLKISSDMEHIRATDSPRLEDKRQQREDWAAILVFNHLMSGLEAYVSAHLYDFPGDLEMRALPGGGRGIGVTLPLGGRR